MNNPVNGGAWTASQDKTTKFAGTMWGKGGRDKGSRGKLCMNPCVYDVDKRESTYYERIIQKISLMVQDLSLIHI